MEQTHRVPTSLASIALFVVAFVTGIALGSLASLADKAPGVLGRVLLLLASTGLAWGVAALVVGASELSAQAQRSQAGS